MSDIGVFVEFDDECWNEETHCVWNELNIRIVNYDKVIELGGQMEGEKRFASAYISYTTENFEPHLVINNGIPEFYYVFDGASWTITDSVTWQNNRNGIIVETYHCDGNKKITRIKKNNICNFEDVCK